MEHTVIAATPPVTLPVRDSQARFPVRRVYCVGRNYADHAREMGDTGREPPFFFAKPADAVFEVPENAEIAWPYPSATQDLHHEIELVAALESGGHDLSVEQAAASIWGYAVGLDMTRRDRQAEAKKTSRPWEVGKAFDHSAPIGPLVSARQTGPLSSGRIALSVNGALRQQGDLSDMIWSVPEAVAYLSTLFTLAPGDLIFTGTPSGVAAVVAGDRLEGEIEGVGSLRLRVQ